METLDQSIFTEQFYKQGNKLPNKGNNITKYKELVRARQGPLAPRSRQIYWLARIARFALRARATHESQVRKMNHCLLVRRPSEACFSESEARHFPARQTQPSPGLSELPLKG